MTRSVGRGKARIWLFGAWGLYLVLPVLATVLYSLATVWRNRAFPDGFTLRWWQETLSEPRVVSATTRSFVLATVTVVLVALVTLPAIYWGHIRQPRVRTYLQLAALLPFALPFVVLAYGMKNAAGITELTRPFEASWQLLILGHVALSFPFFLWPVDAALSSMRVRSLREAAETSGASPVQTLFRVVIPNIRAGLVTGAILTFATSFGEYSVAKVITGSSFETLPVWQVAALDDTRGNPNGVAVMAVAVFTLGFLASLLIARVGGGQGSTLAPAISRKEEG